MKNFTNRENIKSLLLEYSAFESLHIDNIDYEPLIKNLKEDVTFNKLLDEGVVNNESLCVHICDMHLNGD